MKGNLSWTRLEEIRDIPNQELGMDHLWIPVQTEGGYGENACVPPTSQTQILKPESLM